MDDIKARAASLIRIMERCCYFKKEDWGKVSSHYLHLVIRALKLIGYNNKECARALGVGQITITTGDTFARKVARGEIKGKFYELYRKFHHLALVRLDYMRKDEELDDKAGWIVIHPDKAGEWKGDGVVYHTYRDALASEFVNDGFARIVKITWPTVHGI